MTHEEACTQLRALGADLKYGRLTLRMGDEVERVAGAGYPDAIDPRLVRSDVRPGARPRHPQSHVAR